MNQKDLDSFLTQTLTDHRLSGGEKRALADLLTDGHVDEQKLALNRHVAFEIARRELIDPVSVQVLDWLEEVVKAMQPRQQQSSGRAGIAEACFGPGDECPNRLIHWLGQAKRQLDICVFTITDDRISRAILAAHKRRVAVRIVTDDEKEHDLGSDIQEFREAGIPVRIDRTPFHMHHKFAIFDNEVVLTGSYNWTRSAADNNHENMVISSDPRLVTAFARAFERVWEELA